MSEAQAFFFKPGTIPTTTTASISMAGVISGIN